MFIVLIHIILIFKYFSRALKSLFIIRYSSLYRFTLAVNGIREHSDLFLNLFQEFLLTLSLLIAYTYCENSKLNFIFKIRRFLSLLFLRVRLTFTPCKGPEKCSVLKMVASVFSVCMI